jgi:hypothetical protein
MERHYLLALAYVASHVTANCSIGTRPGEAIVPQSPQLLPQIRWQDSAVQISDQ